MSLAAGARQTRGRFRPRETMVKNPYADARLNKDIRSYVAASNRSGNSSQWSEKPEVPSTDEILGLDHSEQGDVIDLVPNQIEGPWPDVQIYLKSHYNLLREDAVSPLRDAVAYFKHTPSMGDSSSVAIYDKV